MVEMVIKNSVGLHARPAAVFCTEAKKYASDITISKDGESYNAKSVVMVMSAGIECGDRVVIEAKGSDSTAAEKGLTDLLKSLED